MVDWCLPAFTTYDCDHWYKADYQLLYLIAVGATSGRAGAAGAPLGAMASAELSGLAYANGTVGACLLFRNDCDDCQVGLVNVYIPMVGGANNQDQVRDGAFRYHLWTSNEGAVWYLGACLYLLHMIVTTFRE